MSQETVMKFFEAVRKDESAIGRLRTISENVDDFARLSADLGRERGFAFEPSDVRDTLDALARKNEGGLSDQELSAVAGGRATVICLPGGGGGPVGFGPVAMTYYCGSIRYLLLQGPHGRG